MDLRDLEDRICKIEKEFNRLKLCFISSATPEELLINCQAWATEILGVDMEQELSQRNVQVLPTSNSQQIDDVIPLVDVEDDIAMLLSSFPQNPKPNGIRPSSHGKLVKLTSYADEQKKDDDAATTIYNPYNLSKANSNERNVTCIPGDINILKVGHVSSKTDIASSNGYPDVLIEKEIDMYCKSVHNEILLDANVFNKSVLPERETLEIAHAQISLENIVTSPLSCEQINIDNIIEECSLSLSRQGTKIPNDWETASANVFDIDTSFEHFMVSSVGFGTTVNDGVQNTNVLHPVIISNVERSTDSDVFPTFGSRPDIRIVDTPISNPGSCKPEIGLRTVNSELCSKSKQRSICASSSVNGAAKQLEIGSESTRFEYILGHESIDGEEEEWKKWDPNERIHGEIEQEENNKSNTKDKDAEKAFEKSIKEEIPYCISNQVQNDISENDNSSRSIKICHNSSKMETPDTICNDSMDWKRIATDSWTHQFKKSKLSTEEQDQEFKVDQAETPSRVIETIILYSEDEYDSQDEDVNGVDDDLMMNSTLNADSSDFSQDATQFATRSVEDSESAKSNAEDSESIKSHAEDSEYVKSNAEDSEPVNENTENSEVVKEEFMEKFGGDSIQKVFRKRIFVNKVLKGAEVLWAKTRPQDKQAVDIKKKAAIKVIDEVFHSKAKLHACQICELRIRDYQRAIIHAMTHFVKRSYKCEICGFLSSDKQKFINHLRRQLKCIQLLGANVYDKNDFISKSGRKKKIKSINLEKLKKCKKLQRSVKVSLIRITALENMGLKYKECMERLTAIGCPLPHDL